MKFVLQNCVDFFALKFNFENHLIANFYFYIRLLFEHKFQYRP